MRSVFNGDWMRGGMRRVKKIDQIVENFRPMRILNARWSKWDDGARGGSHDAGRTNAVAERVIPGVRLLRKN